MILLVVFLQAYLQLSHKLTPMSADVHSNTPGAALPHSLPTLQKVPSD